MTTEEKEDDTGDSKEPVGDLPGYVPMGEDRQIIEVYRYWVHSNDEAHLSGGINYDKAWQACWKTLAVMTSRSYDTPSGRVGRRFIQALVE